VGGVLRHGGEQHEHVLVDFDTDTPTDEDLSY